MTDYVGADGAATVAYAAYCAEFERLAIGGRAPLDRTAFARETAARRAPLDALARFRADTDADGQDAVAFGAIGVKRLRGEDMTAAEARAAAAELRAGAARAEARELRAKAAEARAGVLRARGTVSKAKRADAARKRADAPESDPKSRIRWRFGAGVKRRLNEKIDVAEARAVAAEARAAAAEARAAAADRVAVVARAAVPMSVDGNDDDDDDANATDWTEVGRLLALAGGGASGLADGAPPAEDTDSVAFVTRFLPDLLPRKAKDALLARVRTSRDMLALADAAPRMWAPLLDTPDMWRTLVHDRFVAPLAPLLASHHDYNEPMLAAALTPSTALLRLNQEPDAPRVQYARVYDAYAALFERLWFVLLRDTEPYREERGRVTETPLYSKWHDGNDAQPREVSAADRVSRTTLAHAMAALRDTHPLHAVTLTVPNAHTFEPEVYVHTIDARPAHPANVSRGDSVQYTPYVRIRTKWWKIAVYWRGALSDDALRARVAARLRAGGTASVYVHFADNPMAARPFDDATLATLRAHGFATPRDMIAHTQHVMAASHQAAMTDGGGGGGGALAFQDVKIMTDHSQSNAGMFTAATEPWHDATLPLRARRLMLDVSLFSAGITQVGWMATGVLAEAAHFAAPRPRHIVLTTFGALPAANNDGRAAYLLERMDAAEMRAHVAALMAPYGAAGEPMPLLHLPDVSIVAAMFGATAALPPSLRLALPLLRRTRDRTDGEVYSEAAAAVARWLAMPSDARELYVTLAHFSMTDDPVSRDSERILELFWLLWLTKAYANGGNAFDNEARARRRMATEAWPPVAFVFYRAADGPPVATRSGETTHTARVVRAPTTAAAQARGASRISLRFARASTTRTLVAGAPRVCAVEVPDDAFAGNNALHETIDMRGVDNPVVTGMRYRMRDDAIDESGGANVPLMPMRYEASITETDTPETTSTLRYALDALAFSAETDTADTPVGETMASANRAYMLVGEWRMIAPMTPFTPGNMSGLIASWEMARVETGQGRRFPWDGDYCRDARSGVFPLIRAPAALTLRFHHDDPHQYAADGGGSILARQIDTLLHRLARSTAGRTLRPGDNDQAHITLHLSQYAVVNSTLRLALVASVAPATRDVTIDTIVGAAAARAETRVESMRTQARREYRRAKRDDDDAGAASDAAIKDARLAAASAARARTTAENNEAERMALNMGGGDIFKEVLTTVAQDTLAIRAAVRAADAADVVVDVARAALDAAHDALDRARDAVLRREQDDVPAAVKYMIDTTGFRDTWLPDIDVSVSLVGVRSSGPDALPDAYIVARARTLIANKAIAHMVQPNVAAPVSHSLANTLARSPAMRAFMRRWRVTLTPADGGGGGATLLMRYVWNADTE
jgi:hypothetical protein